MDGLRSGDLVRFFCILLSLVMALPMAAAEQLELRNAMQILRDRGASSVDAALIFGEPIISGELHGQGFNLTLGQCDREEEAYKCRVTVFSTCLPVPGLSQAESMQLTNSYNQEFDNRGTMYRDFVPALGDVACLRLRRDLHEEDTFDLSDVSDWNLAVNDFERHIERALQRQRSKNILGLN